MVELAGAGDGYRLGFAGDTFNTAVYLARAGHAVSYLTRLGDDPYSDDVIAICSAEGIGTGMIERLPGRRPGLYLIENAADGERSFHYWRGEAPVRGLFDQLPGTPAADAFYFTGITVAVTRTGQANLLAFLDAMKSRGTTIAFDPNYRPALWDDAQQAREHCGAVLPFCDIVLPTLEDETALWGIETVEDCRRFYKEHGIGETVVKGPALTAYVFTGDTVVERQADPVDAIDTTGAGDSFNAGYLAARFNDAAPADALTAAQRLAANVVQHRGAILPRAPQR